MRVSLLNADWLRPFTWRMFIVTSMALLALALILWKLSVPSAHAAEQPLGGSVPLALTVESGMAAAGAVEDTLKACLARIPRESTVGQRMVAEQACNRDERERKSVQINPFQSPSP